MDTTMNGLETVPLHPYLRYGLAIAVLRDEYGDAPTEDGLRKALSGSLLEGLEKFRMRTEDKPDTSEFLKFESVSCADLEQGKAGGAKEGVYLYPSVVSNDGGASETFKNARDLADQLVAKNANLDKVGIELKRSICPISGEFNNGRTGDKQNPVGTLLEASCATVATVTPDKAASVIFHKDKDQVKLRYTSIIPDLPLRQMTEYIQTFRGLCGSKQGSQMRFVYKPVADIKDLKKRTYQRPPICSGNYPNAPRDSAAFGAVGLLAAIGEWAKVAEAEQRQKALVVLESLADCPLYVVSYDSISQARYSHHVVGLAKLGQLHKIVGDLYFRTVLYEDADAALVKRDGNNYRLFYMMASRFLQNFDAPSLRDFQAFRTEYAQSLNALWNTYFMEKQNIPESIVTAARALGQWINSAAYRTAAEENENKPDAKKLIRRDKAKILAEFESAVFSAREPTDLLSRVSVRAGRLLGYDAPLQAQEFYDATMTGTITLAQAQQMLVAYMRLRSVYTKAVESDEPVETITVELPEISDTEIPQE